MKRAADTELALPSPPAESSQSPASSSAELHPAGPARKRARSGTSPEERREARAHRNRIAAQNSRDRRKAQFAYLEHRVAELEDENRQLRAGMGLVGLRHVEDDRADEQSQRDRARDRENEELRERIKTLETGWDAVVKALTASGLPLNIPSVTPPSTKPIVSPSSESSTSPPSQPSTTAFPVLVPPSPVFPISPAPSDASSSSSNTPLFPLDFDDFVPTRHLARMANTDAPPLSSVPLQRVGPCPRSRISFNSSSSSTTLVQHPINRRQPSQLAKSRLLQPWTTWPWRTSSARSSRPLPPSRRRPCRLALYLLPSASTRPPGRGPRHSLGPSQPPTNKPCRPRPRRH
ncbi:hypothetical protein AcW1_008749 [Taiwanofungus camphoratus]|nr:hypothetical protein AcW1_008749 [Antrodia cinnamomea]